MLSSAIREILGSLDFILKIVQLGSSYNRCDYKGRDYQETEQPCAIESRTQVLAQVLKPSDGHCNVHFHH